MRRTKPVVIWLADVDGVAHATVHRLPTLSSLRTVCGLVPVNVRWAWPAKSKCSSCLAAIAELVPA